MVYKEMKVNNQDIVDVKFVNNDTAFVLYMIEDHNVIVVDYLQMDNIVE
jgi:hypothetical protein